MLVSQPDYGEQALEIADRLILSGAIDVVVIDSVAALVPKSELCNLIPEQLMIDGYSFHSNKESE